MDIVLGVSMTPTTVSIALVEGEKADGVIVEHDVFDITAIDGPATSNAPDHVIAAILGTQEGAFGSGHRLISTGVTWTDRADASVLREALIARGIEDVMLVSELHAAAALAQALGRAVGYDRTALMFVERDTASLAIVETADGSVVKVLSQPLDSADPIPVLAEMATGLTPAKSMPQAIYVVGSGVDVTAANAQLKDLVPVPVVAPEEPHLALARGAALASANAPRFDTSTIGLAYSLVPDGETMLYPVAPADEITTFLGHADVSTDGIASESGAPERNKPFLLIGGSLSAIFVAGVAALTIAMVSSLDPAEQPIDQSMGGVAVPPPAVAPPPTVPSAQPVVPQPEPNPPPSAPPQAAAATARSMVPPASPPPRVVVHNAAPAPAAPPAAGPPPPVVVVPVIPPSILQWLPPVPQPPVFNPGPAWGPGGPRPGHGGGHGGKRGHGD
ncbi:hypothetical protein Mycsm_00832 [Mycobacterium sp. JS623]|nr:hypothetical protein Mycsm_00832 [Mycobacterium sp. JS623]